MNATILQNWKKNRQLLLLLIPVLLLGGLIFLIQSSYFIPQSDNLTLAISIDFVFTIPIIYFLAIRKTNISNLTAITLMIAGLFLGLYFLPKENQSYLELFKTYFFPIIELGVLSVIIWKVRATIKKYKMLKIDYEENKTEISFDFFTVLKNSCEEALPKFPASLLATEIAVIYYSIISWKSKKINPLKEFTYHITSGTVGLLGALIFIIAVETIAIHLLLAEWNVTIAWILSILSIYTGFQLLAFAKSFSKRPILIENDMLYLCYGIMSETEIELKNIKSIEISEKPLEELIEIEAVESKTKSKLYQKLSPLGNLEGHNIIIRLHEKTTLNGIYGIKKEFKVLAFHVDEKVEFTKQIENLIQSK
ncbi:hypothetical protein Fleli_0136 [Bernardetia litoralis DSM 6794]|uniref:Uncharacterized protein n=1 Tax=Bernardetia litoralis (strain ATCC 23117 / DSM 6794 / NBRC 15988 / NCIMB 1366 / Fx l1 / Sio-4) TaxID=880071 RepID=I4AFA1_BERLS|nr:hypothetical protein [Bernardetia litoralis]AFM02636.1 hypothetical protein Fleli_0136 [Bernardetia litoralis DSM 6794]